MKSVLDVTVDDGAVARDRVGEPERIPRYRGGNLRHYALEPGDASAVCDSEYQEVGARRVVES
ncbi:hypothetical protein ABZV75_26800 [Streptomyces flaveolus]|uniref:hypothetical protein n=1 Tax=Streptomyces flaveolus TaxID=67297 RepID=UPI0033A533F6